jgi:hypothetical protein
MKLIVFITALLASFITSDDLFGHDYLVRTHFPKLWINEHGRELAILAGLGYCHQDLQTDTDSFLHNYLFHENGWTDYKVSTVNIATKPFNTDYSFSALKKDNTAVFSFSGTESMEQLVDEYLGTDEMVNMFDDNPFMPVPQVFRYFKDVFDAIQPYVVEQFQNITSPNMDVYFIGHSLGGALATLFAYYFKSDKQFLQHYINENVVTLGTPRIGNHAFADLIDSNIERLYRFVNKNDVIAALHSDLAWHTKGLYILTESENIKGEFEVESCYDAVDKEGDTSCKILSSLKVLNPTYHTTYFGYNIGGICSVKGNELPESSFTLDNFYDGVKGKVIEELSHFLFGEINGFV